jgi:hypothetical protein
VIAPRTTPFDRGSFDHLGIPTDEQKEGAVFLEQDGVWVTSPRDHPLNIEWVRYEPGSPMHARLRTAPFHVAYRVKNLVEALRGQDVIVPPLDLGNGWATIAFIDVDGIVVELMQYEDHDEKGWLR